MTSTAEKLDKLMTSKHNLKPQQTAWKEHTSAFKSFLSLEIMFYACLLTVSFYFVNPWTVSHKAPSVHGIFPGKNTGVGCHFLLQGNLPDPGIERMSVARLLHWQAGSSPLHHLRVPGKNLEAVSLPTSNILKNQHTLANLRLFPSSI